MTKPSDVYVANSDSMLGPEQITDVAKFVEQGWGFRKGTANARGLLPADEKFNGLYWHDTDSGILNKFDGSNWSRVLRFAHGFFAGGTSETGTVTVSHGLPVAPVNVFTTDWQSGAAANSRKVLPNSVSTLQIQFVILNGGQPLPGNPVVFSWLALY